MDVKIFDIQHFCVQDGPGIRTSVFFKGCPLRCLWCHNPESQTATPELLYYANKCVMCRRCAGVCPNGAIAFTEDERRMLQNLCTRCGACADACPEGALELAGSDAGTEDILSEVARDEMFYRTSGGGVTFTGGEPLSQPEALINLLDGCAARGLHTAVETSCFTDGGTFRAVVERASLMICDIKAMSPTLHRRLTGVTNEGILENIRWLIRESGRPSWIRLPIIPGFNDRDEELEAAGRFLAGGTMQRVELLPYHDTGRSKYIAMGKEYSCADTTAPDKEKMERFRTILRNCKLPDVR
ncbi:MAG: glycyl-radical enzyme activating protein [Oscillospiraceae bacterium]